MSFKCRSLVGQPSFSCVHGFIKLSNKEIDQDVFGDAAGDNETNDGIETLNEEVAELPQQEKAAMQQQQGWFSWLSLGMLGTANTRNYNHIFTQEIIMVNSLSTFPIC